MSCFALRFAFFSFAVRGPFMTSENLRGGMVDKQMKGEVIKMWTLSLTEPIVHAIGLKETNLSTHSYMNL